MKRFRFSIYMTERDMNILEELHDQADPDRTHSRSALIAQAVKITLALCKLKGGIDIWQDPAQQGKSIPACGPLQGSE